MRLATGCCLGLAVVLSGCTVQRAGLGRARDDGGQIQSDGGRLEGGAHEGGLDAGRPDAGAPDAGAPDAGAPDAGAPDAGAPDAGAPDAGAPDAGAPDAGPPDAGAPDAGAPDAGAPDAGPPSCDSIYSGLTAYQLCVEGPTTCELYSASFALHSCDYRCGVAGGTCIRAYTHPLGVHCTERTPINCSDDRLSQICVCSR